MLPLFGPRSRPSGPRGLGNSLRIVGGGMTTPRPILADVVDCALGAGQKGDQTDKGQDRGKWKRD